jgi:DNA-binding Lrp family transcriptional regulator
MIKAYILILARVGKLESVLKEMRNLSNIENIAVVAGDYDIIARGSVENLEQLMEITDKIQLIDGIKRTTTLVIEKETAL